MPENQVLLSLAAVFFNLGFVAALWAAGGRRRYRVTLHLLFVTFNASIVTYGAQSKLFFSGRANVPNEEWVSELLVPVLIYFMAISLPIYAATSLTYAASRTFGFYFFLTLATLLLIVLSSLSIAVAIFAG